MKTLLLCVVLFFSMGCITAPPSFSQSVLDQINNTIVFEKSDYRLSRQALILCGVSDSILNGLRARHESELTRLEAWRAAEKAKLIP